MTYVGRDENDRPSIAATPVATDPAPRSHHTAAVAGAIDVALTHAIATALNEWGHFHGLPPLQWGVVHQDGFETIEGYATGTRANRRRNLSAWVATMGLSRHDDTSPWFLDGDGWHIEIHPEPPRTLAPDTAP